MKLRPHIKSSTKFQAYVPRRRRSVWGDYLRICNLKPVAYTPVDGLVIAAVLIVAAVPLVVHWMWPATTVVSLGLLTAWLMSSYMPLGSLLRFESEKISLEFLQAFVARACEGTCCHDVLGQAMAQGKLKALLQMLTEHRREIDEQNSNAIIREIGRSFFHGSGDNSEYAVAQELLLSLINENIRESQIIAVLHEVIESSPDLYFASDLVECCEPNLYGKLQRIYRCDTEQLRSALLGRCQRTLITNQADVFGLARGPAHAVAFLHRWSHGFASGWHEQSKAVQGYTLRLFEKKPLRTASILEGSLDDRPAGATIEIKRLRTICDPARINIALSQIDVADCTAIQKHAIALFQTVYRKPKAAKPAELALAF